MTRLIQIADARGVRRVCVVEGDVLRTIDGYSSVYVLATAALSAGTPLGTFATEHLGAERLEYDAIYEGRVGWRVLPVVDHPDDPARLLISGTGLTHERSADQRQAMHAADATPTDSLRMYEWGVAGGRPAAGQIGAEPEWFYKGGGDLLRGHGQPLVVPSYAGDGGEEPEIAGVYMIDPLGNPRRLGMTIGNEFADHVLEKRNYLYLAASKMRNCSAGPELIVDANFSDVHGEVAVERDGTVLWSRPIHTGEAAMCHSLANMEHHHFKHAPHRRPGDLHLHYFGADAFSFGAGIALKDGDVMRVHFDGFGRDLRNPIVMENRANSLIAVAPA